MATMLRSCTFFDQEGAKPKGRTEIKRFGGWHADVKAMPFYDRNNACTREIAEQNGVPSGNIELVNATEDNLASMAGSTVDMILSHTSYGFHYPFNTYGAAAFKALRPGGVLLLTLRYLATANNIYSKDGTVMRGTAAPEDTVNEAKALGFHCVLKTEKEYTCGLKLEANTLAEGNGAEGNCRVMRCTKPRTSQVGGVV